MTGDATIRVLVADDHPVYREGLVGLLNTTGDLTVVGQARDGAEAVELARTLRPDVVVMDVGMPVLDGLEATRRILEQDPATRVLMLTMLDDETVVAAVRAGARGYVVKSSSPASTIAAIRCVALGDVIFSAELATRLNRLLSSGTPPPFVGLTPREQEVLELVASGWDNTRIAASLGVADKTVRNLVSAIFLKLQAADRTDAIAKARRAGLGRGHSR